MDAKIQKQNSQVEDFKGRALATFSVFARNETFLGLPSRVFVMGLTITLTVMTMWYWLAGIVFGFLFFYGMYQIHQKDPKAFEVWVRALRRFMINKSSRWNAGNYKSTRLIVLKRE